MPYKPGHPNFKQPPAEDQLLWRYMDLPSFLAMMQYRALVFTRADLMNDDWEGSFGNPDLDMSYDSVVDVPPPGPLVLQSNEAYKNTELVNLSCWLASESEYFGMWQVYQRLGRGIAVQTTWKDIADNLDIDGELDIKAGHVQYVDLDTFKMQKADMFRPFMYKRREFAPENEVRLVIGGATIEQPEFGKPSTYTLLEKAPPVIRANADLQALVKRVVIAPQTPSWVFDVIAEEITRHDYDFPVAKSNMDRPRYE